MVLVWLFGLINHLVMSLSNGSCLVIAALPYLVLSCLALSCLVLSCLILSCLDWSCLALSSLVLSSLVLSRLVLSLCCHGHGLAVSCLVL